MAKIDGEKPVTVKTETKLQVCAGTTVESVKQHGSSLQQLAVSLFDADKNGVLDEREADRFNNCIFKGGNQSLTIYDRAYDKNNPAITEIKYGEHPEIIFENKYCTYENGTLMIDTRWSDNVENGMYIGMQPSKGGKVTVDITNNSVTVDGGKYDFLAATHAAIQVNNADVGQIATSGGSVQLNNVKDNRLFHDSATEVMATMSTDITADRNSKIKIKRDEE